MTYRLIRALRQFYKRREHVTKMADDEDLNDKEYVKLINESKSWRDKSDEHLKLVNQRRLATVKSREHVTKKAQAENDMTKTLVVVVLMFMSCQLVNPVRRIMQAVLPTSSLGCGSAYFYFKYLTSPALALDVSSHFFIYSVCNKRFIEKLSQKWRRLVSRSRVTPTSEQQAGPTTEGVRVPSTSKKVQTTTI